MSPTSTNATKEHAHELIDRLPPAQLAAVAGLLEAMLDPAFHAMPTMAIEEEEITAETAASTAPALPSGAVRGSRMKRSFASSDSRSAHE